MIKVLLNHSILEYCINYIFDQLISNFVVINFNAVLHHVGDYLRISVTGFDRLIVLNHCKIESKDDDTVYITCTDFSEPLTLIIRNGVLADIKGSYDVICDNFLK